MSYYRGDYYRGDYYRGDPGILGFLGKAVKGIGGAVVGGLTGGLGGAIAGGIRGFAGGSSSNLPVPITPNLPALPGMSPGGPPVVMGGGGGAQVAISPLGTLGVKALGPGLHWNKSRYRTLKGELVEKHSRLVKNRHANYGNGRALKRALRRAHGFARLARHVMSFEMTGRHHSRGHFKTRRRGRR